MTASALPMRISTPIVLALALLSCSSAPEQPEEWEQLRLANPDTPYCVERVTGKGSRAGQSQTLSREEIEWYEQHFGVRYIQGDLHGDFEKTITVGQALRRLEAGEDLSSCSKLYYHRTSRAE